MKCTLDGCSRRLTAKGYCGLHYNRWRRHGDPRIAKQAAHRGVTLSEHVEAVRDRSGGPDACWNFTPALGSGGYGHFMHRGVLKMAHVWAYELATGPVPADQIVRHACDNRACLNPRHLIPGTHQQNMDDKVERHRQARLHGTTNPLSRLTDEQIIEIRARFASGSASRRELAEEYETSRSNIEHIVSGRRWKHLLPEIGIAA